MSKTPIARHAADVTTVLLPMPAAAMIPAMARIEADTRRSAALTKEAAAC